MELVAGGTGFSHMLSLVLPKMQHTTPVHWGQRTGLWRVNSIVVALSSGQEHCSHFLQEMDAKFPTNE